MGKSVSRAVVLKIVLVTLYFIAIGAVIWAITSKHAPALLNPKGTIADQQRALMLIATLLMLIVVIPVFVLTFGIAWKYRASNTKAKHSPYWEGNHLLEGIWWGLPCAIIAILAVVTWSSSHALDPYKPIASDKPPINIQVIALQWKWLFIYPDQSIATVNYIRIPEKTPVNFEITSDAPMNSFWIPSLAGQIYAMSGMSTQLHIMADQVGKYNGSSANISGKGFSGMKFVVDATTDPDFHSWLDTIKDSTPNLDMDAYTQLAAPSENAPVKIYRLTDHEIYDKIINKYMGPTTNDTHNDNSMQGMDM